jgi:hypothetical protein
VKVVAQPRQSGKTAELIRESAERFVYIVCFDRREADRVWRTSLQMKLDIPNPITWEDFLEKRYHAPGIRGFLFDNLDAMILRMAGGIPIHTVTLTTDST